MKIETIETRTQEEIEDLKREWLRDGTWDIKKNGFEAYKSELIEFRKRIEAEQEIQKLKKAIAENEKIVMLTSELFVNAQLAKYLFKLQARIKALEDVIEEQNSRY